MNNRFPIYIVSHRRWDTCLTAESLSAMGLDYKLVVEPSNIKEYIAKFGAARVLSVPDVFHDKYQNLDDLGRTKSQGPGPARNFAWEHSKEQGHEFHWVMDDNINGFYIYNHNREIKVMDSTPIKCMEDFVIQYENISMAGPNYFMFVARKRKYQPYIPNTRIYSCNLIRNDLPYRWRGRYNEDTILSLDMLKDGWCTVQFNMFLQNKTPTQVLGGGNTDNFYSSEGTYPKSEMLKEAYPSLVRLVYKFRRWHHVVDYSPFKNNRLKRKSDAQTPKRMNLAIVKKGGV